MNIPFFNYPDLFNKNESKLLEILKDVGSRGAFIMQRDLEEFEEKIAQYTGSKYAVGVANATDGLQIGLMAGGLKEGGEVIISSHTMIATASAIHYAGGIPIPVEAGKDLMIDLESLEQAINEKTVAIMPTQLNGRTCDMDKLEELANQYSLDIYEDAAQALGSKFKSKSAGTFGVASAISLYPAKLLGCLGDGGIVLTNSSDVYEKMILLRDHGRDPNSGEVVSWGLNTRLDNLQAAFLNFFMTKYDEVIERRRYIASLYNEGLSAIEQLTLPPAPNEGNHYDVFQNYEIQALHRNDLKLFLADKGIGSLVQWSGKAIHQFNRLNFSQKLPKTDKIFSEILMIPLNMSISDKEVNHVIEAIKDFYKGEI
mgnify:CR=1 FL=1